MAWIYKGKNLIEMDKYDEALQCCNKAIEINPQNADAWISSPARNRRSRTHIDRLYPSWHSLEVTSKPAKTFLLALFLS